MATLRPTAPIPVIDLFAGPGGLGEGFSSVRDQNGKPVFKIALSVEMDEHAHRTLELRAFYRQFTDETRPEEYYDYLRNPSPDARDKLFRRYRLESNAARAEAWRHELRPQTARWVTKRAREALGDAQTWVLIGGPPCQAYSLAGRSRRKHDQHFAKDKKHKLYERYLALITDLEPPVFVMENVKGMLSAKLGEKSTIDQILDDLRAAGSGYDVYSFVTATDEPSDLHPTDFVIRAEDYGVPQCRHRVILLGVRRANFPNRPSFDVLRPVGKRTTAADVLSSMPAMRSRISHRLGGPLDTNDAWLGILTESLADVRDSDDRVVAKARTALKNASLNHSANRIAVSRARRRSSSMPYAAWFQRDQRAPYALNHESRSHMPTDLGRYLFCASFAKVHGRSPKLSDFPKALLPAHRNVDRGVSASHFADRFRVQLGSQPSTTITSHISKDGHYYIHYDPSQCRSLSVREAARLQTFPDDYFFEGNRTQQYHQVGNAVPPLLALQLGEIVASVFCADLKD